MTEWLNGIMIICFMRRQFFENLKCIKFCLSVQNLKKKYLDFHQGQYVLKRAETNFVRYKKMRTFWKKFFCKKRYFLLKKGLLLGQVGLKTRRKLNLKGIFLNFKFMEFHLCAKNLENWGLTLGPVSLDTRRKYVWN